MKRVACLLAGLLAVAASAHAAPASVPTFTKDVAPIVFNNCAACHRAGEVAPMTLTSYEDVRPWAKVIKNKVVSREMPPWGADPAHSLKMRNDRSLSQAQIDTIVAWVDGGAPKGSDADLPPMPKFAEGWTFGREPDAILEMPVDFTIPAEGELGVQMFYSKVPWSEDKFAETLEKVCVSTVESGQMTKDLAILISKDQPWLTTEGFLDALDENLQKRMASA